ncbi:MAG TPA: MBL fold metallo-hydrolase [Thermoplasmata archaeon]|jgi:glyoxylase-like metal-dependent hydrolase (beta-lactamase superfamily II)
MKVHYIAGVGYDSNVYLLEDEDPIVVDTGTGMYADATLEEISKIVPLKKVGRIVLTHCHYDHIGGAARFQDQTGGRIYLHETEADPIRAGDSSLAIADMFGEKLRQLDIAPLKTGEKLKCGSASLEVLHTPGHSPGSIALHDKASKSAIVGDTVFCDGGVGRWDLPGGDLEELVKSVKRLATLELANMYPGHGSYAEGDAQQHMRLAARYLAEAI